MQLLREQQGFEGREAAARRGTRLRELPCAELESRRRVSAEAGEGRAAVCERLGMSQAERGRQRGSAATAGRQATELRGRGRPVAAAVGVLAWTLKAGEGESFQSSSGATHRCQEGHCGE